MAYKKILIIIGAIIFVIGTFFFVVIYLLRYESPAINAVRKTLNLPAIIVDGKNISMNLIDENTASIKQFYENQDFSSYGIRIDFSTDDGQKRLKIQERKMLNKLIEDIAVEKIASEWGIVLSDEAVLSAMERPMDEMDSKKSVESKLENLYGWSLNDFGEKVVRGQLLREKVAAKFEQQNKADESMNARIMQAKKELDDNRTFADVAQKYSEGSTAHEGGVMGWFNESQLQDKIGQTVAQMKVGEYSDILETPLGLHIVRVNDISEENGKKIVHVSQIIVLKKTFAQFLDERIKAMDVKEFLSEYDWDPAEGLMIYTDTDMNDFENQMRQDALNMQKKLLSK